MKKLLYLACAAFSLFMTACDEFAPPQRRTYVPIRDRFTGTYADAAGMVSHVTLYDNGKTQLYQDANGVRRYLNILEGSDETRSKQYRVYRYKVGNTWWYPAGTMVYRSSGGLPATLPFGPGGIITERFQGIDSGIMYYANYPKIIFQH